MEVRLTLINSGKLRPKTSSGPNSGIVFIFCLVTQKGKFSLDDFNKAIDEIRESILGFKKHMKKAWIQAVAWQKIEERKDMNQRLISTQSERARE